MNIRILPIAVLALAAAAPTPGVAEGALVPLFRGGAWEGVSGLIGYGDRIWFSNSVKFRNHNSADIYSYDPISGTSRYERQLFSQDAGDPAVMDGLLYWPFEDSRFSAGRGEFVVTDGGRWLWRGLPDGQAFHVHAMAAHDGVLFAATSAWRGGIQRSSDAGASWHIVHDHPTPSGQVSRFTDLAFLDGVLFAGLTAYRLNGPKLFRLRHDTLEPLHGWPPGQRSAALETHAGWLYAVNDSGKERRVWRTNGERVEAVEALDGVNIRALASSGEQMFAVSGASGVGNLWQSRDGMDWTLLQEFASDEPVDVAVYGGRVYVGTRNARTGGALWGPLAPTTAEPPLPPSPPSPAWPPGPPGSPWADRLPVIAPSTSGTHPPDLLAFREQLTRVSSFSEYRALASRYLAPLVSSGAPGDGEALSSLLDIGLEDKEVETFGGALNASLLDMHRWYVLRAMGLNGHGRVPLALVKEPWDAPPNRAEKYFAVPSAAAWVSGYLGHWDDGLIEALITRLENGKGPAWLAGDWVGALTALTGERLGYDASAWRSWWSRHRGMAKLTEATFMMGSDSGEPAEGPVHEVRVSDFYLDRHEVTNEEFAAFVAATGHVTDPEREGFGWHWTGTWRRVPGAQWRQPHGPDANLKAAPRHPVVQVSWNDAFAYCAWRGKRLPSEAQWERAARGQGHRYAWGDAPPRGKRGARASYGSDECCRADGADGFLYTAPVGAFPSGDSPAGVADLTGNVWEWVTDTFDPTFYDRSPHRDPINLAPGEQKVIRGGGWGNNPWGLRATLRHANNPAYGLSMVGLRCAKPSKIKGKVKGADS